MELLRYLHIEYGKGVGCLPVGLVLLLLMESLTLCTIKILPMVMVETDGEVHDIVLFWIVADL